MVEQNHQRTVSRIYESSRCHEQTGYVETFRCHVFMLSSHCEVLVPFGRFVGRLSKNGTNPNVLPFMKKLGQLDGPGVQR